MARMHFIQRAKREHITCFMIFALFAEGHEAVVDQLILEINNQFDSEQTIGAKIQIQP
jgi:hypothetical protein